MTKKKTAISSEPAQRVTYRAMVKRAELDGNYYHPGDETTLEGLTAEQIGFGLAKFYYVPDNWDNVPLAVKEAYEASR